jgi:hypothetical protein
MTEQEQLDYVQSNGLALECFENPSEVVQIAAVKQNPYAVTFIDIPSELVQLATVEKFAWAIEYIKNPTQAVIRSALKNTTLINNPPAYADTVNELFADNSLLAKKWIRYGLTQYDYNNQGIT